MAAESLACAQCGRRFGDRSNLARHMVVHSGARPHACSECDAAFTTSGNLNRHVAARHHVAVATAAPQPPAAEAKAETDDDLPLLQRQRSRDARTAIPSTTTTNRRIGRKKVLTKEAAAPPRAEGEPREVPTYACAYCGEEFAWKASRTLHQRRCRPSNAPPPDVAEAATFVCPDCEAELCSRGKLRRHRVFHCPFRDDALLCPLDDDGGIDDNNEELCARSPSSRDGDDNDNDDDGEEAEARTPPTIPAAAFGASPVSSSGDGKCDARHSRKRRRLSIASEPLAYVCGVDLCLRAFRRRRHLRQHLAQCHRECALAPPGDASRLRL